MSFEFVSSRAPGRAPTDLQQEDPCPISGTVSPRHPVSVDPSGIAINLLTENPNDPSGAHWFWTRVIPNRPVRLSAGEELHLLVSPTSRHLHQDYGPGVLLHHVSLVQ